MGTTHKKSFLVQPIADVPMPEGFQRMMCPKENLPEVFNNCASAFLHKAISNESINEAAGYQGIQSYLAMLTLPSIEGLAGHYAGAMAICNKYCKERAAEILTAAKKQQIKFDDIGDFAHKFLSKDFMPGTLHPVTKDIQKYFKDLDNAKSPDERNSITRGMINSYESKTNNSKLTEELEKCGMEELIPHIDEIMQKDTRISRFAASAAETTKDQGRGL
jgi:hypothetical protein